MVGDSRGKEAAALLIAWSYRRDGAEMWGQEYSDHNLPPANRFVCVAGLDAVLAGLGDKAWRRRLWVCDARAVP